MTFELYIWGPAFGLPSIEPECIAAATYLHNLLPAEQWVLIVSHDASLSPTGQLPLLRHGETNISGFSRIVDYLRTTHNRSLDQALSSRQRSKATALRAHLQNHALPLVDCTLYTTPSNYTNHTRPAWSRILPTLSNYTIPPARCDSARKRALPLGLTIPSGVDTSSSSSSNAPPASAAGQAGTAQANHEAAMNTLASNSPSLLFKQRNRSLAAALRETQSRVRFRVESVVDDLVEPMAGLLKESGRIKDAVGDGRTGGYLVADELTSIDCLVFGYLSLLLFPEWEGDWVKQVMNKRYKNVTAYVERLRGELLGQGEAGVVRVEDAMAAPYMSAVVTADSFADDKKPSSSLPWRRPPLPASPTVLTNLRMTFSSLYHNLIISPIFTPARRLHLLGASSLFFAVPSSPLHPYLAQQANPPMITRMFRYFLLPTAALLVLTTTTTLLSVLLPYRLSPYLPTFSTVLPETIQHILLNLKPSGVGEQFKIFARPIPSSGSSGLASFGEAGDMLFRGLFGNPVHRTEPMTPRPHFLDDDFDLSSLEGYARSRGWKGEGSSGRGGAFVETVVVEQPRLAESSAGEGRGDEGAPVVGVDLEVDGDIVTDGTMR